MLPVPVGPHGMSRKQTRGSKARAINIIKRKLQYIWAVRYDKAQRDRVRIGYLRHDYPAYMGVNLLRRRTAKTGHRSKSFCRLSRRSRTSRSPRMNCNS